MPEPSPSPAPQPEVTPSPTPAPAPTPTPTPTPAPAPAPTPEPTPSPTPEPVKAWNDNWRETYAGTDDKKLNVLKRYTDPKAFIDAHFALKGRLDSGELKAVKPLPANPNQQEVAAYRKDNGIPDNAGDYLTNLPNGLVIGEDDKAVMTAMADDWHAANIPPQYVHAMIAAYNKYQDKVGAESSALDERTARETEDALRADWGTDYHVNKNLAKSVLDRAPPEFAKSLRQAVLPDGTLLANHPDAARWLAQIGREINPAATLVPGDPVNAGKTLEGRKADLEKMMGNRASEYWKGPKAADMQKEYRDIVDALQKIRQRAA